MSIDQTLYRQWELLRNIPRHPRKISATELTARLNGMGYTVNKRTVERDLRMFEGMFGLVADDRDRPYGWHWRADAPALYLPALDDNEAVLLALAEAQVAQLLPPPTLVALDPIFRAAQEKLKTVTGIQSLKDWTRKVYFAPAGQPLLPAQVQPDIHRIVTTGLFRNQWLRLRYRKFGAASTVTLEVRPLGLVTRGPMRYLIALLRGLDDSRTLALSRIEQAELLQEHFQIPEDFSLSDFIQEGRMGYGNCKVEKLVLRIDRHRAEELSETPLSNDQIISPGSDASLILRATVPITPQLKRWLLGFAGEIKVLKPDSLRRTMVKLVHKMVANYE